MHITSIDCLSNELANLKTEMDVLGDALIATEQQLEQLTMSKEEVGRGTAQAQALKERVD